MIFQRALQRELFGAAGAVFTTLFTITITFMLIKILGQAAGGKVASADVITSRGLTEDLDEHESNGDGEQGGKNCTCGTE